MAHDDSETIWQAAWPLFYFTGETTLAEAVLDRALLLNPNATMALMARGAIHAARNRPELAIEDCERAQRLSPFDPLGHFIAASVALAHVVARRFDQAIEWADRALRDQPRLIVPIRAKIVANAHLGRLDEARAEVRRMLALYPGLTIATWRASAASFAPELVALYVDGLRLAGLPEE